MNKILLLLILLPNIAFAAVCGEYDYILGKGLCDGGLSSKAIFDKATQTWQWTCLSATTDTEQCFSVATKITKPGRTIKTLRVNADGSLADKKIISDPKNNYVEGEVLVTFKRNKINLKTTGGRVKLKNLTNKKGLRIKQTHNKSNFSVVDAPGKTTQQIMADLATDPDVEAVQPNYKKSYSAINSNDLYRARLWGLDNTGQTVNLITGTADADIDAPEAWALNSGTNSDIIVAVLDSGVNYNHPDFSGQMWDGSACVDENGSALGNCNYGYDFENDDKTPLPYDETHGTHVAGTIGAALNNSNGIIGVAPRVKIMALRFGLDTAGEVRAIDFAIENGAKVINASFGGSYDAAELSAISRFRDAGGIFVAAAGNAGTNNDSSHTYPSDYTLDNIISVAATNQFDNIASFSNYGLTSVDVGAPGVNIYSSVLPVAITENLNFDSATPPAMPNNWTGTGDWGTEFKVGFNNVLYGDATNHSPYASSSNSMATITNFNLSSDLMTELHFDTWCDTEYTDPDLGGDYLALDLSSNGGSSFTEAVRWNENVLDDDFDPDNVSAVRSYNVQLSSAYNTSNFTFRFRWLTDATDNNYDGCLIDNVHLDHFGVGEAYDYSDGTSMATPHVAGLAALIWGAKPDLNYSQVRTLILNQGDSLASLTNYVATGKRINAYNSLAVFKPILGYSTDNVLPTSQTVQATNGSGLVTLNFKAKAGWPGLPISLSNFSYSINSGSSWSSLATSSASLSANWYNNNYQTASNFSSSTYSFSFATKHGDVADLNNYSGSLLIKFQASTTVGFGDYVNASMTLDNVAPSAPVITQPASTSTVRTSTYTITGSAEASSTVRIFNGGTQIGAQSLAQGVTTFSIDVDITQNIINNFTAHSVDASGNQSATTTIPTIIHSFVGVANVDGDDTATYYTNDNTPDIVLDGEVGMDCRWAEADLAYASMSATNTCSVVSATGTCSLTNQGADGVKNIYISCKDASDNEQTADTNIDLIFSLDTTAPTIDNLLVVSNPALAGTVLIDFDVTDAVSGLNYNQTPTVLITNLLSSPYTVAQSSFASGAWSGNFTLLANSEETVATVIANNFQDVAGNVISSTTVGTFTVDTITPTAVLSGLPAAITSSGSATITVGGTGVSTYKYRTNLGNYSSAISTSTNISLSSLGLGFHTIDVIGGDVAGNWQTEPTSYTWAISSAVLTITDDNGQYDVAFSQPDNTCVFSRGVATTTTITATASSTDSILDFSAMSVISGSYKYATTSGDIIIQAGSSAGRLDFTIPSGTQITAPSSWTGLMTLPKISANNTVSVTPTSGYTATVALVVELGTGDTNISFGKGTRLVLPGQAGKLAGWYRNSSFTAISATCSADSQTVGNSLAAGSDCAIANGSDLVIWTKHLTKFIAYTQTVISSGGGGGGGGGGVSVPVKVSCTTVSYADWQTSCQDNFQYRSVSFSTPSGCNLTVAQEEARKRPCNKAIECDSVEYGAWPLGCFRGYQYRSVIKSSPSGCLLNTTQSTGLKRTCGQAPEVTTDPVIEPKPEKKAEPAKLDAKKIIEEEKKLIVKIDPKVAQKYKGMMIRQTETGNRLWYLNPSDMKRYLILNTEAITSLANRFGKKMQQKLLDRIAVGGIDYLKAIDTDKDGLSDELEAKIGSSRLVADTDDDGFSDLAELRFGYNALGEGKIDARQQKLYYQYLGDLTGKDSDGDVLPDDFEVAYGTSYKLVDTDFDKFKDGFEIAHGYNPLNKNKLSISLVSSKRNAGLILVNSKKFAWYVNPLNNKRYYLGYSAHNTLNRIAKPITNLELRKIAVGQ